MKPSVAFLVLLFAVSTAICHQSVKNGTRVAAELNLEAELAKDSVSVSKRAVEYAYDEDYEEDEEYDNSYGDEPVYGDEEGEMYRRSPPENYYDTEEGDDGDYDENEDYEYEAEDNEEEYDEEDDEEWDDDRRFKRSSHYNDFDDNDDGDEFDEEEDFEEENDDEEEMERGLINSLYEEAEDNDADQDYDVDNEEEDEEEDEEERILYSRSVEEDDYDEDSDDEDDEFSIADYEDDDDQEYDNDDEEEEEDEDDNGDGYDFDEEEFGGRVQKRFSAKTPKRKLRLYIANLDKRISDIRSKEYYNTVQCWLEKADKMETLRNQLTTYQGREPQASHPRARGPDKSPQDMTTFELKSEIQNLKTRIAYIQANPRYDWNHYKCHRELGESMGRYVEKLQTELASREEQELTPLRRVQGEDRVIRPEWDSSWRQRQERDVTATEPEEESRGKRDCDEDDDDSPSISQLAAQTVQIEKEIQRKIVRKLEERLQGGGESEGATTTEEGVLQKTLDSAIEKNIGNKAQKQLKQQIGDLPQKVRELERNYEELKQEVENSPWSRFQRVMMEHLKKNNQLEEALTREELEKLETMHKMSEHERKALMKTLREKIRLSSEEDDEDDDDEKKVIQVKAPKNSVKTKPRKGGKKAKQPQEPRKKVPDNMKGKKNKAKAQLAKTAESRKKQNKIANTQQRKGKPRKGSEKKAQGKQPRKQPVKPATPGRKRPPAEQKKKTPHGVRKLPHSKPSRQGELNKKRLFSQKKAQETRLNKQLSEKTKGRKNRPEAPKKKSGQMKEKDRPELKANKSGEQKKGLRKPPNRARDMKKLLKQKRKKERKQKRKERKQKQKIQRMREQEKKQKKKERKEKKQRKREKLGKQQNKLKKNGAKQELPKQEKGRKEERQGQGNKGEAARKELKRQKRDFVGLSRGEWEISHTVSQNDDPLSSGGGSTSIKYQLPPKSESVGRLLKSGDLVKTEPLVLRDGHPLEWSGDYQQQSSQPGLRNRRSTSPDSGSDTEKTVDENLQTNERCSECEAQVGEEVCGSNGKTYNSLCHALNCGKLREMDVTFGPCRDRDPCSRNSCSRDEICAPMTYGPCLTLYTNNGRKLPCRQYICVAKENCGHTEYSEVCGVDGKTYPTLCHLQQRGVKLAYSGHCREALCSGQVCGRNGVTYPSSCHARARNVRVDYKGTCFAENAENDGVSSCADVRRTGMCGPAAECPDPVIPRGACCPVCGGGVEVRPESGQLAELARDWPEINHLYMVENFLRRLVPTESQSHCELSLTLTNTGAVMMVLEAVDPRHSAVCQAAAMEVAEKINRPSHSDDSLRPLAREARLLSLGDTVGESVRAQGDIITSDVGHARASAASKMVNSYNDRVKSIESTAHQYEGEGGSGCSELSTSLVPLTACLVAVIVPLLL